MSDEHIEAQDVINVLQQIVGEQAVQIAILRAQAAKRLRDQPTTRV